MLHSVQRHAVVALNDRLLLLSRGWHGWRSVAVAPLPTVSPSIGEALDQLGFRGRARLVAGNRWMRLEIVSLPEARKDSSEQQIVAGLIKTAASGNAQRVRHQQWHNRLLLASIADATANALVADAQSHGISIDGMEPMACWLTRWRASNWTRRDGWHVLLEPGFATLTHVAKGRPEWIRIVPNDAQGDAFEELLERQAAVSGTRPSPVDVLAVATPEPTLSPTWRGQCSVLFGESR